MAMYFLHQWCLPAHEAQRGIILDSMELAVMLPEWERAFSVIGRKHCSISRCLANTE
jgi:hypothetical protein